jgi:hypothetical protein
VAGLSTAIGCAAAWGEQDPHPFNGPGAFRLGMVMLSPRESHPFFPQDVADTAWGDGDLELDFEAFGQFRLSESRALAFLGPQPAIVVGPFSVMKRVQSPWLVG